MSWPVLWGTLKQTPRMAGLLSPGNPLLSGTEHQQLPRPWSLWTLASTSLLRQSSRPHWGSPPCPTSWRLSWGHTPGNPRPHLIFPSFLRTTVFHCPMLGALKAIVSYIFKFFPFLRWEGKSVSLSSSCWKWKSPSQEEPFPLEWEEGEPRKQRLKLGGVSWVPHHSVSKNSVLLFLKQVQSIYKFYLTT